jgi:hypothetical protein
MPVQHIKDWANANAEIERLGLRLDAVRGIISTLVQRETPENHWGLKHWREVEAVVLRRWKHTIRLKEVGMKQVSKVKEGPEIDYSWWEKSDEVGVRVPIIDNLFAIVGDKFGLSSGSLDRAWEMARDEKLQKARQGLA